MILTSRFRAEDGKLYVIHWYETGLEAYPADGGKAGTIDCYRAFSQWLNKCETLSEQYKSWPERIGATLGVIAGCLTIVILAPYWFVKGMFK